MRKSSIKVLWRERGEFFFACKGLDGQKKLARQICAPCESLTVLSEGLGDNGCATPSQEAAQANEKKRAWLFVVLDRGKKKKKKKGNSTFNKPC